MKLKIMKLKIMKLKIILFLTLMNFSLLAISDFNLSLKSGYVLANGVGNAAEAEGANIAPLHSFKVGFAFEIGFSELIAIQPEIHFVQAGYNVTINTTISNIDYEFNTERKINYIKIPIWLKFRLAQSRIGNFYVGPGISLAFNTGVEQSESMVIQNGISNDISESVRFADFDFGLGVILGYQFKLGEGWNFLFDISYLNGLIDIAADRENNSQLLLNSEFFIGIGISYTFYAN